MKIKYYIVAFASLLLTGCSDFLDLTPISEASSANYYKNTSDINSALSACSLLTNVGISRARVYFSTQNPFTFTKYSGYNPEVNMKGGSLTPGIDYGTYPLSKSFVFGLNVTF